MKTTAVLLLMVCIMLFFSGCSGGKKENGMVKIINGVKVFLNTEKPSVEKLIITPREVFRLRGMDEDISDKSQEFVWARSLDIDSQGNIYILDNPSASVKKFAPDGTFIKSFGRQGHGPGETQSPFMIVILNDVIYVTDYSVDQMVTYDTNGNFLRNIRLRGKYPLFIRSVGSDKFVGYMEYWHRIKKLTYQGFNLVLMDSEFNEIRILREYKFKFDPHYNNFQDRYTAYALAEDKIYVAEDNREKYRINVFDFQGQLLYVIEKDYEKVKFNQTELEEMNNSLWMIYKKFGRKGYTPIRSIYKKAITNMYYDKYGRLLVCSSIERNETNQYDFLVDVFKAGKFLKKVKLDIGSSGYDFFKAYDEKIFFIGERIYHLDQGKSLLRILEY